MIKTYMILAFDVERRISLILHLLNACCYPGHPLHAIPAASGHSVRILSVGGSVVDLYLDSTPDLYRELPSGTLTVLEGQLRERGTQSLRQIKGDKARCDDQRMVLGRD